MLIQAAAAQINKNTVDSLFYMMYLFPHSNQFASDRENIKSWTPTFHYRFIKFTPDSKNKSKIWKSARVASTLQFKADINFPHLIINLHNVYPDLPAFSVSYPLSGWPRWPR